MPFADGSRRSKVLAVFAALSAACSGSGSKGTAPAPSGSAAKPATVEAGRVVLTDAAVRRLGVATQAVEQHALPATRVVGGDVVSAIGRSVIVSAPVSGLVGAAGKTFAVPGQQLRRGEPVLRLTPVATVDRDLKAQGDRALSIAEAKLAAVEARVNRTEKLLSEGAASERMLEEARAELAVAKADRDAAIARTRMLDRSPLEADVTVVLRAPDDGAIRQMNVAPGGIVASGTPLFEVVRTGSLCVKTSIFVGDLRKIQTDQPARVRPLGAAPGTADVEALPTAGPPTAEPQTATFDLYYSLPADTDLHPGERVAVTLTYRAAAPAFVAPLSSVVRDTRGDAFVYEVVAPGKYERRHVEVERVVASGAVFTRGVTNGMQVAVAGVPELFALEFGGGK